MDTSGSQSDGNQSDCGRHDEHSDTGNAGKEKREDEQ